MNLQLRRDLRALRRKLTAIQQEHAGHALRDVVLRLAQYRHAKRLAFYLPNDGEIDPTTLLEHCVQGGKTCYLPVVHPTGQNRLHFARYDPGAPLVINRFGIAEPRLTRNRIAPVWTLDIIFLPLVAFDRSGTRLGMGGGYYDRSLAHVGASKTQKPLLIGLAHSCQEVSVLPRAPWDVSLHMIATEKELIIASQMD